MRGCYTGRVIIWVLLIDSGCAQYDHCLSPTGCHEEECCFNLVAKTGPVCDRIPGCAASFGPDCCRNSRPVYTDYGIFYGYSILLDEPHIYKDNGKRYLEIWLGIPYARPPTRENNLRFKKPVPPPFSGMKYDATRFRSSCSQPVVNPDAPFTTWSTSPYEWDQRLGLQQTDAQRNATSEDCLYLNIYTINETGSGSSSHYPGPKRRWPILMLLDGLDHLVGSGNRYPGHVLAQMGMVVVTVNYRLGPFGYLATRSHLNSHTWVDDPVNSAHGNYGLWDQVEALKFIRNNAAKFFGDPDEITLVGHGSAAADVALHLLSKHSARRTPPLFQRAILISGSDQMEGGFARHPDESAAYAAELAHQVSP